MYAYLVLMAVMVQRGWEVWISAKRLKGPGAGGGKAIQEPLFPAMVMVNALWLAGCWVEVIWAPARFNIVLVGPMLVLWLAVLALKVWIASTLGPLWNVRLVRRAVQPVITHGPYRFLRHPNYLAVILEIAVVPLIAGAYWTALIASAANGWVLLGRIKAEESYLMTFPDYRLWFSGKKRIIPGLW